MMTGGNSFAKTYRDLIVYQKSRHVADTVFALTKSFPNDERYSLVDQIRRISRSIGAQIAEAWAKRRYPNHFVSKLSDADGEKNETEHWLDICVDCHYVKPDASQGIRGELIEIGRMLQAMMDRSEDFKGSGYGRVGEPAPSYGPGDEYFLNTEH